MHVGAAPSQTLPGNSTDPKLFYSGDFTDPKLVCSVGKAPPLCPIDDLI